MKTVKKSFYKLKYINTLYGADTCLFCCSDEIKIKYHLHITKMWILVDQIQTCKYCKDDMCTGTIGLSWAEELNRRICNED